VYVPAVVGASHNTEAVSAVPEALDFVNAIAVVDVVGAVPAKVPVLDVAVALITPPVAEKAMVVLATA
jgi:hypothetical protein